MLGLPVGQDTAATRLTTLGPILALVASAATGCAPGAASPAQFPAPAAERVRAAEQPLSALEQLSPKAKVAMPSIKERAPIQTALEPEALRGDALILATTARCPAEMALVDDRVCVDRWEGSLVERTPQGERPWSPYLSIDGRERSVRAVSLPGVIPQGYISGAQAMAACVASGKRLCTGDEWVQACRGPDDTTFPYGTTRRVRVCNDDIRPVHPVAEIGALLGIEPGELWRSTMNNPLINQLQGSLLATGERAECTNGYGVHDMVGNLHEWIDDPDGTFRGGYYMDTTRNGDGCKYATAAHSFTYHDYSTGFRCCMDPERVE
ncbi:MAG: SUMF1/EgtB/PvdO family nonheme iron enzyme [Polyangiaceae bacterium]|nr:SUMF1/EgtB/PvdO family nonheme iron enzyme [Polyangiaceae bacterium]